MPDKRRAAPAGVVRKPQPKSRGVVNADVPSQTEGLPGVGEGASAADYASDLMPFQADEDEAAPDEATDPAGDGT